MTNNEKRLKVKLESSLSEQPSAYWEVPSVEPNIDSEHWTSRFFNLKNAQPHIEQMILGLALPREADLSEDYATHLDETVVFSSSEAPPDMRRMQEELMLSVYQDVGLTSKTFNSEIGIKAILALAGIEPPHRHRLHELFTLTPPVPRNELERAYRLLGPSFEFPKRVVSLPSLASIFEANDNLYTDIRYRPTIIGQGAIISAWYNLDAALECIQWVIMKHKSNAGLAQLWSMQID